MSWKQVRLRYLAEFNPSPPAGLRENQDVLYPLYPMEAINEFSPPGKPETRPVSSLSSGYSFLDKSDVAYAKVTPCFENGKGLVGTDLQGASFATTEVTVLRPKPGTDQRFLAYLLQSTEFRFAAVASMTGAGGLRRVSESAIRDYTVGMPPMAEQRRIADYLDHETAEIDAFVADQIELLERLEERIRSEVWSAVTLGLEGAKTSSTDLHWAPQVPDHWTIERTSWLFGAIGSGTTPSTDDVGAFEGDIPWVTTSELRERGIERTDRSVSPAALKKYSLRLYPQASILIAMYGATIGRLGWLEGPATVNQAVCVLSDYNAGLARFAFYSLLGARDYIITLASGGGQPNINQEKIRALRLPVPPADEQKRIVEHLDNSVQETASLIADSKRFIELAKERRAALISAAVTGKLDVRSKEAAA